MLWRVTRCACWSHNFLQYVSLPIIDTHDAHACVTITAQEANVVDLSHRRRSLNFLLVEESFGDDVAEDRVIEMQRFLTTHNIRTWSSCDR